MDATLTSPIHFERIAEFGFLHVYNRADSYWLWECPVPGVTDMDILVRVNLDSTSHFQIIDRSTPRWRVLPYDAVSERPRVRDGISALLDDLAGIGINIQLP